MAYRIDYGVEKVICRKEKNFGLRRGWMTIGCFLLFLMVVALYWEEGREVLRYVLIPGDPDVTLEAVESFACELLSGQSFGAAAEAFCTRVLHHGV